MSVNERNLVWQIHRRSLQLFEPSLELFDLASDGLHLRRDRSLHGLVVDGVAAEAERGDRRVRELVRDRLASLVADGVELEVERGDRRARELVRDRLASAVADA